MQEMPVRQGFLLSKWSDLIGGFPAPRGELASSSFRESSILNGCVTMQAKNSMPLKSRYLFVASMDVDPDKEALFNEVYDTEHVPTLLKVPGVLAVSRMEGESFVMSIGGEERTVAHDGPRHSAIYEIDGPHVLVSREWAKAVEAGRWPTEVRPFTRNRRHALYKLR
jgi:hypothetical protein